MRRIEGWLTWRWEAGCAVTRDGAVTASLDYRQLPSVDKRWVKVNLAWTARRVLHYSPRPLSTCRQSLCQTTLHPPISQTSASWPEDDRARTPCLANSSAITCTHTHTHTHTFIHSFCQRIIVNIMTSTCTFKCAFYIVNATRSVRNHKLIQGGAKNGATISHCKYSENSMTELRGNWWTSAILYAEHSH